MQIQFTRRRGEKKKDHIDNNYLAPAIQYFACICRKLMLD